MAQVYNEFIYLLKISTNDPVLKCHYVWMLS